MNALVVLSGGQDSTTCLYWAMREFGQENVMSVTFDYGQRHQIEIECARRISDHAGVKNFLLPIDTFSALGGNALTEEEIQPAVSSQKDRGLPSTFVPGRNIILLTFAAALAYQHSINHIVIGVSQTDYSGYPDCREETIKALQTCLCLGLDHSIVIHTPLIQLSKAQSVALAIEIGAMPALAHSHTCYLGCYPPCGLCDACRLRAKGFAEAGVKDPLLMR